jgi:hypothetical protein
MAARVDECLAAVVVELADTLVAGHDLMEFLQVLAERCVELLEVRCGGAAAGRHRGVLRQPRSLFHPQLSCQAPGSPWQSRTLLASAGTLGC